MLTSARITATATIVLAGAGLMIPAILDFEQQEVSAKNATIEYFNNLFSSPQGQLLDKIINEAEITLWQEYKTLNEANSQLPINRQKESDEIWRIADKKSIEHYKEEELRSLAASLLNITDTVYECARFYELFEDIGSDNERFKRGFLKLDDSGHLSRTTRNYTDIFLSFILSFSGTRLTNPECHQDVAIKLFGSKFADPLWHLRLFLYCDEFIIDNYFRDKRSDSSPLYRLESIAMVFTQADLESRFPDKKYIVARTKSHSDTYKQGNPDTTTLNIRLEECS